MISPLKKYPKLKQFQLYQKGEISSYQYEIRCKGRSRGVLVPFCFVVLDKKEVLMIIQDEGAEEVLGQVFLRSYTSLGTSVDLCGSSLDEKIAFSLILARQYIDDPDSFIVDESLEAPELLPPLQYFPQLQSSQLIETSSIGAYRYELHTQCASAQKIQYHHVLFCYAPFEEKPCFVVSAESFGDFRPTLGLFHNNGHSNLGPKPNLLDISSFRETAFALVRKELLNTDGEADYMLPPFQKGILVEKGLIGSFRCAMFVDIPQHKGRTYFHGFALFAGGMTKPEFLFVLEKSPHQPTPNLVLYRHDTCTNLGFEQSMLDVKFFRDRVVALLRLILREEELQRNEIGPLTAKSLLRIQKVYTLVCGSVFLNILLLLFGGDLVHSEQLGAATLSLLSGGVYSFTVMCSALLLRFVGLSRRSSCVCLFVLCLPLIDKGFLWTAALIGILLGYVIGQKYQTYQLHYNWFGLSKSSKQKLSNIVYASSVIARS